MIPHLLSDQSLSIYSWLMYIRMPIFITLTKFYVATQPSELHCVECLLGMNDTI